MQHWVCWCCCCQVASVMSDSVRPHRRQPTRLPCPWDSPGKNTGVGCHILLQCMKGKEKLKSLSRVWLFTTPWTSAHQAPPSMGFSRQEYWSGVPLPSPSIGSIPVQLMHPSQPSPSYLLHLPTLCSSIVWSFHLSPSLCNVLKLFLEYFPPASHTSHLLTSNNGSVMS